MGRCSLFMEWLSLKNWFLNSFGEDHSCCAGTGLNWSWLESTWVTVLHSMTGPVLGVFVQTSSAFFRGRTLFDLTMFVMIKFLFGFELNVCFSVFKFLKACEQFWEFFLVLGPSILTALTAFNKSRALIAGFVSNRSLSFSITYRPSCELAFSVAV